MKNKKKLYISIIAFVIISLFIYINYVNSRKNKHFCLQSITYLSSRYFIEDDSGSRIKKPNGNTAIFKTKNDAMEYCLTFIEK